MPEKKKEFRIREWTRVIHGEAASKANSRRLMTVDGKPRIIKSKKALSYLVDFQRQCPVLDPLFEDDVEVELKMFYSSRRPDLDESVVLDAMQGRIYRNDRQVRRKIVEWGLDKSDPRVEIRVSRLVDEREGSA